MPHSDIPSIHAHFPVNASVPSRLIELISWFDSFIDPSRFYFPEMKGEYLDAGYSDGGIELVKYFGLFMSLGEGSMLAYWFYEGCDRQNAPVVMLGSEGELAVIGNSIEEVIARLIEKKLPAGDLHYLFFDFYNYDDGNLIQPLKEWVEDKWELNYEKRMKLISEEPQQYHPNIEEWFDQWVPED